jgi:hypothetical protein
MSSRRKNVPKDGLRGFSCDRGAGRCNKLAPRHGLSYHGSMLTFRSLTTNPVYGPGVTGTTGPGTGGAGAVASAGNGAGSIRNQATTPINATSAPT